MINSDQIARRITGDGDLGRNINEVADYFRTSLDFGTLATLLRHSNSTVVSAATWIASEVVDRGRGRELLPSLVEILQFGSDADAMQVVEPVLLLIETDDHEAVRLVASIASGEQRSELSEWVHKIRDRLGATP